MEEEVKKKAESAPVPEIAKKELGLVTIVGIALLIVLVTVYVMLHYNKKSPSYDKDNANVFFLNLGKVRAAVLNSEIRMECIEDAIRNFPDGEKDALTSEFKYRISFLKGYVSKLVEFQNKTAPCFKVNTSHSSAQSGKAGSLSITSTDQRVVIIKDEIDKIEKEARALSRNDGFFWISGYWKWLEIVFWGEFGVIIGILAWVSSQVEKGKYSKEIYENEKYWYIVEIFMGPIVVIAVFFLLKQVIGALMTGITEEDIRGSIYMTLGVSFTLGLFIRRTLGIFDYFKNKFPLPKALETKDTKITQ